MQKDLTVFNVVLRPFLVNYANKNTLNNYSVPTNTTHNPKTGSFGSTSQTNIPVCDSRLRCYRNARSPCTDTGDQLFRRCISNLSYGTYLSHISNHPYPVRSWIRDCRENSISGENEV